MIDYTTKCGNVFGILEHKIAMVMALFCCNDIIMCFVDRFPPSLPHLECRPLDPRDLTRRLSWTKYDKVPRGKPLCDGQREIKFNVFKFFIDLMQFNFIDTIAFLRLCTSTMYFIAGN